MTWPERLYKRVVPVLRKRPCQSAPIVSAALLLLGAVCFGNSRSLGSVLLSLVILPALLLAFLTLLGIGVARRTGAREIGIAAAMAVVSPFAYLASAHLKDRAEFLIWAATHQAQLRQAVQKDGVVTWWDGWGMAGLENDSYLVVARDDAIGSVDAAERWRKQQGLSCEIVDTQRMWPRLYILTTFNCGDTVGDFGRPAGTPIKNMPKPSQRSKAGDATSGSTKTFRDETDVRKALLQWLDEKQHGQQDGSVP